MIYRLEKAVDEGVRITKSEGGEVVKKKFYSTHMSGRLAIPAHKTLGKQGVFDTGLTPEQEAYFEEKLGHDKGYLGKKSEFWITYGIMIPAAGESLNDEIPEDELKIAILKGRAKIVGDIVLSRAAIKSNANCKWVLTNDETEAEVVADKVTWIARASQKFDSMSLEDHENYLKSLGTDTRGMSTKIIRGKVAADVTSSPKKFIMIAEDKQQSNKIFINDLIAYDIVRMNKSNYVNQDGETIAYSQTDMLDYINNKANAKVIIAWKKQLEEAKKY